jgi:hypothetical protein
MCARPRSRHSGLHSGPAQLGQRRLPPSSPSSHRSSGGAVHPRWISATPTRPSTRRSAWRGVPQGRKQTIHAGSTAAPAGSCAATSGISSRRTSSALIGRSANSPNPRPAFLARRNALPAPSELGSGSGSGSLLLLRCQLCGGAAIMSIEMALSTSLHKRTASEHRSNSHDTELERNHRPNGRAAVHHRRDPASGARANSHCLALRGLGQPLGSHSAPARPLSWAARPVRRPRGQPAQGPGPSAVVRAPQATEALRSQQTSV